MSSTVRAGVGACDHPREQVPGGEEVDVNQLVQCEVRGGDCVERREVHHARPPRFATRSSSGFSLMFCSGSAVSACRRRLVIHPLVQDELAFGLVDHCPVLCNFCNSGGYNFCNSRGYVVAGGALQRGVQSESSAACWSKPLRVSSSE